MYKINTSMSIFSILFVTFAPDFLIASVQISAYWSSPFFSITIIA